MKQFIFATFVAFLSLPLFAQQGIVIDQVVAVVGNYPIKYSDIEQQYLQLKAQGMAAKTDARCLILEELLFQKLLLHQAKIDSIEVSEREVESELDRRLRMFISQIGSQAELEKHFGKTIPEIKEDFRADVKEQLLTQRMQAEITGEIKVTPADVRNYYNSFSTDSLPLINTQIEYAQIIIEPEVDDQQKEQLIKRLEGIRKEIIESSNPANTFGAKATLYSDDRASAQKRGELGFTNRGDLVPEFSAVAFNLKKGEVSEIVETEFGYHIIQLIERKGEKINVRHILLMPKATPEAKVKALEKLDSIANIIRIDSLSFSEAAIKFSDDKTSRNNGGVAVNPYTGDTKFEPEQIMDPVTNYELKKLKIGEMSDVYETRGERGMTVYKIIKLKNKIKPHTANLNDDYNYIKELAQIQKQQKFIANWIEQKLETTYIKIDPSFRNCKFQQTDWLK